MNKKWWDLLVTTMLAGSVLLAACGSQDSAGKTESNGSQQDFHYAMSGLYKPFNFKENGQLAGFDVEIGQALADKMGMKAAPVTNPWETIVQGLLAKKYDAILGSMTITPERLKVVNFTNPYYRSGSEIFVADSNNDIKTPSNLKGKKIGVVKASPYKDLALTFTDKANVMEYDSDLTALMDLPTGRLDAVITDQMVGLRMIKEGKAKIKDVGEPLTHDNQAIAIRKEDKQLQDKLNKALDEIIKDGTYDKISNKWFGRNILGEKK
ncbi:ABC transporter substrate-binding protein [Aneurinibacillus sp. Ricciae_BoGa-3]|uniref:ABC transporter substrate-binding protein n=1 Tax=Aneurinibacillus sp. Ricciae_BoGa-3 TaxID=3022697 RepID=UPI0023411916|nr:ABC transporter substrate-binding protein [Aneurinibacillus sp. Ricciae_BoGa-3]WCK55189.1 ABC transporter substrate-binding protein [Aneurinibacillus sp. Ricciae_BoGa-3]